MKITGLQYKILGESLLLIPVIMLIMFGIGEISGGIISGVQHFIQLIPLIVLAIACWYYPKTGGFSLTIIAVILATIYFFSFTSFPLSARLLNNFLLFGIPAIAGFSFIASSYSPRDS